MAVRAAGLDGGHVAYYTLTWSWLREDANYTKHAYSKKKKEFFPTIYLKLHYEVLTLNVFQDWSRSLHDKDRALLLDRNAPWLSEGELRHITGIVVHRSVIIFFSYRRNNCKLW